MIWVWFVLAYWLIHLAMFVMASVLADRQDSR
jgi:hypothetical protein